MRFYTEKHRHYCGIDLHARTLYVCILDADGEVLLHRNLPCDPEHFLRTVAPYREGLVVAVECIFTWYWLADLCAREGIAFVLGHALYMRAIHGAKAKNDRIDAHKTAALLRGGLLPQAYVYPAEMRATRDLLRRRLHFVRHRGQLLAHIQNTHHQYNRVAPGKRIAYRSNRDGVAEGFDDASTTRSRLGAERDSAPGPGNEVRERRDRGALAPILTGADQTGRTRDVSPLTTGGLMIVGRRATFLGWWKCWTTWCCRTWSRQWPLTMTRGATTKPWPANELLR